MKKTLQINDELLLAIYGKMVNAISDGIMITDADQVEAPDGPRILYVNDAICTITGYSREELIGKTPRLLQGPATSSAELDKIRQALRQHEPVKADLVNYHKSGREYIVQLEIIPVKDEVSNSHFYIAMQKDVTELRKAEKILRDSEEFNRRMFESSPDCLKILDKDGKLEHMNSNGCQLMEIDDFNPFRTKNWSDLWPEDARQQVHDSLNRAKLGEVSHFHAFCPTAKGTPKWWDVVVCPVLDSEHNVLKIISSSRDITHHKNEQERKSRFLRVVGHELNTPLTSIKGYAQLMLQMMQQAGTDQSLYFPVERIESQVNRMSRLIHEILEVSRLESGKSPLTLEKVDLQDMLRQTIGDLRLSYPQREINYCTKTNFVVMADRNKLEQVMINLVGNAIKFSPDDLPVEIAVEAGPDQMACISVRDYGIGIKQEDQEQLFDLYFQVQEGSRHAGGLGLGLYLVREFIHLQQGKVWLKSEPGDGTTFYFTLPVT